MLYHLLMLHVYVWWGEYLVGYKTYGKTNLDTPCDTTTFNLLNATLNFKFYSNILSPLAI